MEAIIQLAERLGKAVADSPQAAALRQAREELDKHADLIQLLKDYQEQADKVGNLEEQNAPIEVEDKQKLRDLREKLLASDAFKKLTVAQVDYVDLMRKVNTAIQKHLTETEGGQETG